MSTADRDVLVMLLSAAISGEQKYKYTLGCFKHPHPHPSFGVTEQLYQKDSTNLHKSGSKITKSRDNKNISYKYRVTPKMSVSVLMLE